VLASRKIRPSHGTRCGSAPPSAARARYAGRKGATAPVGVPDVGDTDLHRADSAALIDHRLHLVRAF